MNPGDLLQLMVEASLALAGFAGVITALVGRSSNELPRLHRLNLVNLLATSFGALFGSLIALALLSAGVAEGPTWRLLSAMGLIPALFFAWRSFRMVAEDQGFRATALSRVMIGINVPFALICALQVWNVFVLAAFWPVFLLLVAMFAIGCFSFTRLLLYRDP